MHAKLPFGPDPDVSQRLGTQSLPANDIAVPSTAGRVPASNRRRSAFASKRDADRTTEQFDLVIATALLAQSDHSHEIDRLIDLLQRLLPHVEAISRVIAVERGHRKAEGDGGGHLNLGHNELACLIAALPGREREVLGCLRSGLSEKEVGGRLSISVHTVHAYVKSLYRHFNVRSRAELQSLWTREQ
jgi:DNA-binding NarL/FixJ family response regulator